MQLLCNVMVPAERSGHSFDRICPANCRNKIRDTARLEDRCPAKPGSLLMPQFFAGTCSRLELIKISPRSHLPFAFHSPVCPDRFLSHAQPVLPPRPELCQQKINQSREAWETPPTTFSRCVHSEHTSKSQKSVHRLDHLIATRSYEPRALRKWQESCNRNDDTEEEAGKI